MSIFWGCHLSNMPTGTTNLLNVDFILSFGKVAILLILVFYAIFALLIVRQVDLMSKTLITNVSPIIRAISLIHAGFAIGLIFLIWGIL